MEGVEHVGALQSSDFPLFLSDILGPITEMKAPVNADIQRREKEQAEKSQPLQSLRALQNRLE
jgi:hypothetical protein